LEFGDQSYHRASHSEAATATAISCPNRHLAPIPNSAFRNPHSELDRHSEIRNQFVAAPKSCR
jgi:hypothetical protein